MTRRNEITIEEDRICLLHVHRNTVGALVSYIIICILEQEVKQ